MDPTAQARAPVAEGTETLHEMSQLSGDLQRPDHDITPGVCAPADPVPDSIPGELQQCLKVQLSLLLDIRNKSHYMPVDRATPEDLSHSFSC